MMLDTASETAAIHDHPNPAQRVDQMPRCVMAMLQGVYLIREKTSPPVEHSGDFWYWKLTPYGLTLMQALVRASDGGFSYAETFMQPDPDAIPQLVLLNQINSALCVACKEPDARPDWAAILTYSPYLCARGVIMDVARFQHEIDTVIARLREGYYDRSGNRAYHRATAIRRNHHKLYTIKQDTDSCLLHSSDH